jgi:hypothetical protein
MALLAGFTVAGGVGNSASLVAQDTSARVLTLDEAISVARGGNPGLRRALNDIGLNGSESRANWASQLLPSAQLTLFQTSFTGNLQRQAIDNRRCSNPTDARGSRISIVSWPVRWP